MQSYRCRIRQPNRPCADDAALDESIQLKAPNAVEAQRLAHLTTGCAVIDVERLEG